MENPNHTDAQIVDARAKFAEMVISRCGLGVNSTLQMMKPAFEIVMEDKIELSATQGKIEMLEEIIDSVAVHKHNLEFMNIKNSLLLHLSKIQDDDCNQ